MVIVLPRPSNARLRGQLSSNVRQHNVQHRISSIKYGLRRELSSHDLETQNQNRTLLTPQQREMLATVSRSERTGFMHFGESKTSVVSASRAATAPSSRSAVNWFVGWPPHLAPQLRPPGLAAAKMHALLRHIRARRKVKACAKWVLRRSATSGISTEQEAVLPNTSLKLSTNGRPPGPGRWYAVHSHRPGPGVLPLAPA